MILAGVYMNFDWNWSEAERLYRKALSLDPTYASAWQRLGALLMIVGRTEEAVAATRRARELDPTSLSIATSVALRFYLAQRYAEALTELSEAGRLDPTFPQVLLYPGWTLAALGWSTDADR